MGSVDWATASERLIDLNQKQVKSWFCKDTKINVSYETGQYYSTFRKSYDIVRVFLFLRAYDVGMLAMCCIMTFQFGNLLLLLLSELESRPKPSRPIPRQDIDLARPRRDRDFEQKLETRPRLERSKTKTRHKTFETKRLQYFANIFDTKFWTFGELSNTLQYRFLNILLLY